MDSFHKQLDEITPRTALRQNLKLLDPQDTPVALSSPGKPHVLSPGERVPISRDDDKVNTRSRNQSRKEGADGKFQRKNLQKSYAYVDGISLSTVDANISHIKGVDQTYANISTGEDSSMNESIDIKAAAKFRNLRSRARTLSQPKIISTDLRKKPTENISYGTADISGMKGVDQTYANISISEDSSINESLHLETGAKFQKLRGQRRKAISQAELMPATVTGKSHKVQKKLVKNLHEERKQSTKKTEVSLLPTEKTYGDLSTSSIDTSSDSIALNKVKFTGAGNKARGGAISKLDPILPSSIILEERSPERSSKPKNLSPSSTIASDTISPKKSPHHQKKRQSVKRLHNDSLTRKSKNPREETFASDMDESNDTLENVHAAKRQKLSQRAPAIQFNVSSILRNIKEKATQEPKVDDDDDDDDLNEMSLDEEKELQQDIGSPPGGSQKIKEKSFSKESDKDVFRTYRLEAKMNESSNQNSSGEPIPPPVSFRDDVEQHENDTGNNSSKFFPNLQRFSSDDSNSSDVSSNIAAALNLLDQERNPEESYLQSTRLRSSQKRFNKHKITSQPETNVIENIDKQENYSPRKLTPLKSLDNKENSAHRILSPQKSIGNKSISSPRKLTLEKSMGGSSREDISQEENSVVTKDILFSPRKLSLQNNMGDSPMKQSPRKSVGGSPVKQSLRKSVGGSPMKQSPRKSVGGSPVKQSVRKSVGSSPVRQSPRKSVGGSPVKQSPRKSVGGSPVRQSPRKNVGGSPMKQSLRKSVGGSPMKPSPRKSVGGSPVKQSLRKSVGGSPVRQSPRKNVGGSPMKQSPRKSVGSSPVRQSPRKSVGGSPVKQSLRKSVGGSPMKQSPRRSMGGSPVKQSPRKSVGGSPQKQNPEKSMALSPRKQSQQKSILTSPKTQGLQKSIDESTRKANPQMVGSPVKQSPRKSIGGSPRKRSWQESMGVSLQKESPQKSIDVKSMSASKLTVQKSVIDSPQKRSLRKSTVNTPNQQSPQKHVGESPTKGIKYKSRGDLLRKLSLQNSMGDSPRIPSSQKSKGNSPRKLSPQKSKGDSPRKLAIEKSFGDSPRKLSPHKALGDSPNKLSPQKRLGVSPRKLTPQKSWGNSPRKLSLRKSVDNSPRKLSLRKSMDNSPRKLSPQKSMVNSPRKWSPHKDESELSRKLNLQKSLGDFLRNIILGDSLRNIIHEESVDDLQSPQENMDDTSRKVSPQESMRASPRRQTLQNSISDSLRTQNLQSSRSDSPKKLNLEKTTSESPRKLSHQKTIDLQDISFPSERTPQKVLGNQSTSSPVKLSNQKHFSKRKSPSPKRLNPYFKRQATDSFKRLSPQEKLRAIDTSTLMSTSVGGLNSMNSSLSVVGTTSIKSIVLASDEVQVHPEEAIKALRKSKQLQVNSAAENRLSLSGETDNSKQRVGDSLEHKQIEESTSRKYSSVHTDKRSDMSYDKEIISREARMFVGDHEFPATQSKATFGSPGKDHTSSELQSREKKVFTIISEAEHAPELASRTRREQVDKRNYEMIQSTDSGLVNERSYRQDVGSVDSLAQDRKNYGSSPEFLYLNDDDILEEDLMEVDAGQNTGNVRTSDVSEVVLARSKSSSASKATVPEKFGVDVRNDYESSSDEDFNFIPVTIRRTQDIRSMSEDSLGKPTEIEVTPVSNKDGRISESSVQSASGSLSETRKGKQMTMREFLQKLSTKPVKPPIMTDGVKEPQKKIRELIAAVQMSSAQSARKNKKAATKATVKKKKVLPSTVLESITKEIFTHYAKCKVSKEAFKEVVKMSERFWKNSVTDVLNISQARRDYLTITVEDVVRLMKRQGIINATTTLTSLAEEYLPAEEWDVLIPTAYANNMVYPAPE